MDQAVRLMRATRAAPPRRVVEDAARRDVYAAALQQSEDLFAAAASVDAFARPLPLYYGISQAGRAVAAAWLDAGWHARGHGLAEDETRKEWEQDGVLRFRVAPRKRGLFTAVAEALGSGRLTASVEMGALWAALPVADAPGPAGWVPALPVIPEVYLQPAGVARIRGEHYGLLLLSEEEERDADSVNALLANYPAAEGARVVVAQGVVAQEWTRFGRGISVLWPAPPLATDGGATPEYLGSLVRNRVPEYRYRGEHWLVPNVGDGQDALPPLLLWWVLMFGLSLLARYEPAVWRRALDPDVSEEAVLLETLLDEALRDLPILLAEALTGRPHLEPARVTYR